MLEVLERCFNQQLNSDAWQQRLQALLPSIHEDPQQDPQVLNRMRERSDALLGLTA